jgi:hypothetical protein
LWAMHCRGGGGRGGQTSSVMISCMISEMQDLHPSLPPRSYPSDVRAWRVRAFEIFTRTSSSVATVSEWPASAARCSAWGPERMRHSTLAPWWTRAFTTSVWPRVLKSEVQQASAELAGMSGPPLTPCIQCSQC